MFLRFYVFRFDRLALRSIYVFLQMQLRRGKRGRNIFFLFVAAYLLAACSDVITGPRRTLEGKEETHDLRKIIINQTLDNVSAETILDNSNDKDGRNRIIYARMLEIDIGYYEYEENLYNSYRGANFGANALNLILSSAGTVAPVLESAKALHAANNLIGTLRPAVESDLLGGVSMRIYISTMRTQRNTIRKSIIEKMKKPVSDYPMIEAVLDLEKYYRAGTLNRAMAAALDKALKEEENSE